MPAIAAVLGLMLAAVGFTSRAVTLSRIAAIEEQVDDAVSVAAPAPLTVGDPAAEEGVVDLFGNPVSAAVAKYQFDRTGSLYESHSPQTELPRLAPPKT